MSRDPSPFFRLALIGVLAAAFALGACGRKGPLDPPPSASLAGDQAAPAAQAAPDGQAAPGSQESRGRPVGYDGKPIAPGMTNKRIPLDVLLN